MTSCVLICKILLDVGKLNNKNKHEVENANKLLNMKVKVLNGECFDVCCVCRFPLRLLFMVCVPI